jgi:hypothetical protein
MALIACSEFGESISDKARACPKCGFPVPKKTIGAYSIFIFLLSFVKVGSFFYCFGSLLYTMLNEECRFFLIEKMPLPYQLCIKSYFDTSYIHIAFYTLVSGMVITQILEWIYGEPSFEKS